MIAFFDWIDALHPTDFFIGFLIVSFTLIVIFDRLERREWKRDLDRRSRSKVARTRSRNE